MEREALAGDVLNRLQRLSAGRGRSAQPRIPPNVEIEVLEDEVGEVRRGVETKPRRFDIAHPAVKLVPNPLVVAWVRLRHVT